ncbi:FAD-dependent monooxygenase [Mycolicibacterium setense]|uniref:FAD-dependent monooxygenase n=1 Tax=Mycolicibacterium setense TaxID=431269 RepID=UPI00068CA8C6|nr:FAD-dependent monooxygenase [Mycolicibacterium setense]MCV7113656.1 FAD-dependent monooxygenase [Mycolicibacterium setense]
MGDTALVIGAGIGGLAAAHALRRNGWQVEVYERAKDFAQPGSGLSLAPNAMRAFRHLDLDSAVRGEARRLDGLESRLRTGHRVMRIESDTLAAHYGDGFYSVGRRELHRALLDPLDAPVHTAHRALNVIPDGGGAIVTLEGPNGLSAVAADLVVAADGVHSALRTVLFPDHPDARYAGYAAWRGIVPADKAGRFDAQWLTETWGQGLRIGIRPLGDGRIYWYALDTAPAHAIPAPDLSALLPRVVNWSGQVGAVLAATPAETVQVHPVHYLATALPRFVRGPVALLGDAAHATTPDLGQGAALAVEDAVVLARAVTERGVDEGLVSYDTVRRPRAQRIVERSARMGKALQGNTRVTARLRDLTARLTPITADAEFTRSLFGWIPPNTQDPLSAAG